MFKTTTIRRAGQRASVLGMLLLTGTACVDLTVENLEAPDRERATSNANDVLALIGGAFFPTFHTAMQTSLAINLFPYASSEMTSSLNGTQDAQQARDLLEPRVEHNNSSQISQSVGPHGPRMFWAAIGRSANIPYEGLQIINDGMILREAGVDVTERARAFAKFMQGWSWGYAALVFDEVHVVPETLRLPDSQSELNQVVLSTLVGYDVAIQAAVDALQEAIQIAEMHPGIVHFPSLSESFFWFGSPVAISNDQFIRMANTLSARLLVLGPRTPEERAAVDWDRVLAFTEHGVTEDFEMQLAQNRQNTFVLRIQNNTAGGTANARWDYRTIGPADQSGAYQDWINSPVEERGRFNIVTPDRRITGATPTSAGSYTRYRADNNGFPIDRGAYFQSAYQWSRHALDLGLTGNAVGHNAGSHGMITADENNLLRAEALLRTGSVQAAVDLINVSRTREQVAGGVTYPGLPALTVSGVPEVGGQCVPRKDNGDCGDVFTALRYERMIELAGMDILRGYADSRGFGILADGSLLHWPVPGNVLELYGLQEYTYGGVGAPWTATYAPASLP